MAGSPQGRPDFLPAFEGLRGAAALGVVLYHLHEVNVLDPLTRHVPLLFTHGWILVDLFFALSGWVLAHVYYDRLTARQPGSIARFALARFARIFPLFFVVLTVQTLVWIAMSPGDAGYWFATFARQLTLAFTWGPLAETPIVAPSWSISAEVLLYLIFPLLILLRPLATRSGAIATAVVGIGIYLWLALDVGSFQQSKGLGPLRAMGGFLFGLGAWRVSKELSQAMDWILMAVLLFAVSMPHSELIVLMLAFLVLNRLGSPGSLPSRIFSTAPMLWLGKISYSLYLWHWFGITCLMAITQGLAPTTAALLVLPIGALVFGVSAASYHWLEVPARKWIVDSGTSRPIFRVKAKSSVEKA